MPAELLQRDAAKDVLLEPTLSFLLLEGLAPVGRGELEDATGGPLLDEAEQVAEVH